MLPLPELIITWQVRGAGGAGATRAAVSSLSCSLKLLPSEDIQLCFTFLLLGTSTSVFRWKKQTQKQTKPKLVLASRGGNEVFQILSVGC